MPLEELRREIIKDSEMKAAQIEGAAREEASRILSEAKEKIKGMKEKHNGEINTRISLMEMENQTNLDMKIKEEDLKAREKIVDGVLFQIKREVVKKLNEDYAKKIIKEAIDEAVKHYPIEKLIITTNNEGQIPKGFKKVLKAKIYGAIIESEDKKLKINADIEYQVDSNEETIKGIILNYLFPDKESKIDGAHFKKSESERKKKIKQTKKKIIKGRK